MGFRQAAETTWPILLTPLVAALLGRLLSLRSQSASHVVLIAGFVVMIVMYAVSVALFFWTWRKSCAKPGRKAPWAKLLPAALGPALVSIIPFLIMAALKHTASDTLNAPGKIAGRVFKRIRGGGGAAEGAEEGAEVGEAAEGAAEGGEFIEGASDPVLGAALIGNHELDRHAGALLIVPTIFATILGSAVAFFTSAGLTNKC